MTRTPVDDATRATWKAWRDLGMSARSIARAFQRHQSVVCYNTDPKYRQKRLDAQWNIDNLRREKKPHRKWR